MQWALVTSFRDSAATARSDLMAPREGLLARWTPPTTAARWLQALRQPREAFSLDNHFFGGEAPAALFAAPPTSDVRVMGERAEDFVLVAAARRALVVAHRPTPAARLSRTSSDAPLHFPLECDRHQASARAHRTHPSAYTSTTASTPLAPNSSANLARVIGSARCQDRAVWYQCCSSSSNACSSCLSILTLWPRILATPA